MFSSSFAKKACYILICSIIAITAHSAMAEGESAGRIAVVDIERAIMQTDPAKKAIEEFKKQKTVAELYEDFDAKRKAYEKAAEDYTKNRAVMSDSKRAEAEIELNNMREDVQYAGNKIRKNEESLTKQILQQSLQAGAQVVQNIVKEQGIGLLLRIESGAVAHADPSYDITNQVTERLNQIGE